MEFYDKYLARLGAKGTGPDLLDQLLQDAIQSLQRDPPELALTLTGQMAAALLFVAQLQSPLQRSMVDAINSLTSAMADYLEHLGWRQRAVKTEAGWTYEQLPPNS